MKRIFQIEEQVIEDPSTKLRLEFSSVSTDCVVAGEEQPDRDDILKMRLYTSDRERMVTFLFERYGRFIRAEIESTAPDRNVGEATAVGADEEETVAISGNEVDVHSVDSTPGLVQAANFG